MSLPGAPAVDWEATLPLQRARLVRYCARLTGDVDDAEDLAQETLYEAWRCLHKLHDPEGLDRWLNAIARNVCWRWGRRRGRESRQTASLELADDEERHSAADLLADDVDVEVELERAELVELLDRALASLPPETRQVLVQRYVTQAPQAEIARQLGVREGAVEARLQRGKLAMRRVLATTFAPQAAAFGLIAAATGEQQQTRLWCPGCGRHHLEGYLRPGRGEIYLRCPACATSANGYKHYLNARLGNALLGVRTFKPAVSRCLRIIHDLFQVKAADGRVRCPSCQTWVPIKRDVCSRVDAPWDRSESLRLHCPTCQVLDDRESWHSLTWSVPEARRFWREHPRMRFLPGREIEVDGSAAAVTGFESLTDGARIDVVSLRATGAVLRVEGATPQRAEGA